jgi:hypothetical protein
MQETCSVKTGQDSTPHKSLQSRLFRRDKKHLVPPRGTIPRVVIPNRYGENKTNLLSLARDSGAAAAETEERRCGDGVARKGRKLANAAAPPARGTATTTGGAASDADALAGVAGPEWGRMRDRANGDCRGRWPRIRLDASYGE